MENKVLKFGFHNKDTGEIYENMSLSDLEKIKRKENNIKRANLWDAFSKDPSSLTLDQIQELKIQATKNKKTVYLQLSGDDSKFIKILRKHEDMILSLDNEVAGVLMKCSLLSNQDGVLRYRNNRMIKSFSKLRYYLKMTDYKWRGIYKVLKEKEIISEGTFEDKKFLVINPLYSSSNDSIDSYKFIAFHDSLKEYLDPVDYWYLAKLLEIEC